MNDDERDDWQSGTLKVVLNHEEQYSIWPADRDNPPGWRDEGKVGTKDECLAHIEEVWTDMRPLSLRKQMAEAARSPQPPASDIPVEEQESVESLPVRLSRGDHSLEASLRPDRTVSALKECLDRRFVHVRFTETRGGTELGFSLDEESDWSGADFGEGSGKIHLVGRLSLDDVRVRCIADIDLADLRGTGRLEILE